MEWPIKQLEYCTYCPKMCRHTCPLSNTLGKETYTPQSKMHVLNMLRRKAIPWEQEMVEPLYACAGCRLCRQYCVHGNDVASVLEIGRMQAEHKRFSHPRLQRLPERFRARNERLQGKLYHEFSTQLFADEAQVGFFPGCDTIAASIEDIYDALSIFEHLGLHFVRLMNVPYVCAGYPLWAAGHYDAARFVATELVQSLQRYATVVVGCPACTYLLRETLPARGFEHQTEILHVSEFLYLHAERLDIKQTREVAYYHDPCYLARYLGIYDPPRRLLSRCVRSLREFFYSREETACCGGGGLVPHTYPQATQRQAQERLQEVAQFNVPLLVSSCPTCKRTLSREDSSVEVMDLLNLLAWSLKEPARPALEE